ncbi:hypothetical protein HMPREF9964_1270 [Streptococcus dysgalactiae subsp. equisimilis SK1249]|nr:hypothetical protein HMPREF9964_1270 [Streptococcus dysgalactiae subsp. equisimilis SK1249]
MITITIRRLHNFKAISSLERAFCLRLRALQVTFSGLARVLSCCHQPTLGVIHHRLSSP